MQQSGTDKIVEELLKKHKLTSESSGIEALRIILLEKKKKRKTELQQIFRVYGVDNPIRLEEMIKSGKVPEHPGWEDLIEIENLLNELNDLEDDLGKLS